jgi:membrane protease subunit HflC
MVVTVGSEERVRDAASPLFGSSLRNELGKRPFAACSAPSAAR